MDYHRNIHISADLEDYRNFFSDDWGKRIDELTVNTGKLEPLIIDLMMEWRAAAYTASLPALILEHMKAYHDGFVKTRELNTTLLHLANAIVTRMESKLPELTSDPGLLRRIRKAVLDLGIEIEDARDAAAFDFPMQETLPKSCVHGIESGTAAAKNCAPLERQRRRSLPNRPPSHAASPKRYAWIYFRGRLPLLMQTFDSSNQRLSRRRAPACHKGMKTPTAVLRRCILRVQSC
jgi:hypothetical protein